jgi:hypothetical protein
MRSIIFLIIILTTNYIFSGAYKEAIEELKNDNLTESINKFKKAIETDDNAEKASLYYVYLKQFQIEDAKENYKIIKENVENPEYILNAFWQRFYGLSFGHGNEDFFNDLAEEELDNISYSRLRDNVIEIFSKTPTICQYLIFLILSLYSFHSLYSASYGLKCEILSMTLSLNLL